MNLLTIRGAARFTAALLVAAAAVPAAAQDLQLNDAMATTLRGGTYANTNYASQTLLESRASTDAASVARILMKFDTHNTIPLNKGISSAKLTLTVAGGGAETRTLSLYRVKTSYDEPQATWNRRYSATTWTMAGGDLAERFATATVTASVGTDVTFDVTSLVQGVVNGQFGSSRYTRILIVDSGASSSGSLKQFYSDETTDPTVRPTLAITYATTTIVNEPPPDTTTGTSLRVLMWNLHHGVGTDGRYDINRIATWMAKMTPDVIMLNEVEKYTGWGNEDQPARYKALMESKTGRTWHAMFTQEFGNWTSNGKGHLILSKYPLESLARTEITPSSGLKGAGAAGEARIVVNGRIITLVISHLDPESSTMRLTQAKDTLVFAATFPENRIIAGDMNAWPDQTSIAEYRKTYNDSWAVAESKGLAVQFAGLYPSGATKKGRIDYIFYSKTAPNLVVKESRVYDTRDSSGVMPSDHRPVVTTFEVR